MKLFRTKSKYNDIIVLETATWGKCLILNGELQSAESDQHLYHKALCFNAMQPMAKNVLVLGAGEGATAKMLLASHPEKKVCMVEIDQKVIDVCKEHIPSMGGTVWENPRLNLVIDDAFLFVDKCTEKFDIVVSDLSSPIIDGSMEEGFTKKFYTKVKSVLRPGGLFIMQATHRPNIYWDDFQSEFVEPGAWSEWIPSFGVPWYFMGGKYEPKITLAQA